MMAKLELSIKGAGLDDGIWSLCAAQAPVILRGSTGMCGITFRTGLTAGELSDYQC